MQSVANNRDGYSLPSVNREDQQDTDEHVYVDIDFQNSNPTAEGTFEQEPVNGNKDKVIDPNDEYNTLNTRPKPLRIDPNYDHVQKVSLTNFAILSTFSTCSESS